jgi:hypothetical protein
LKADDENEWKVELNGKMFSVPIVIERIFTQSKAVMMQDTTKTMRMTTKPPIKLVNGMHISSSSVVLLPAYKMFKQFDVRILFEIL